MCWREMSYIRNFQHSLPCSPLFPKTEKKSGMIYMKSGFTPDIGTAHTPVSLCALGLLQALTM